MLSGAVIESSRSPAVESPPVHCVVSNAAAVCVDGSTQLNVVGACEYVAAAANAGRASQRAAAHAGTRFRTNIDEVRSFIVLPGS